MRNKEFDFIKGICIVLMVYGHITMIGNFKKEQMVLVELIYTFHMPLFLIISGWFANVDQDFMKIRNRLIQNLLIPYLVFISLYLIGLIGLEYVGIKSNNSPPSSLKEFFHIIFLKPKGAYWFLHTLIILNLTILILRFLNLNNKIIYQIFLLSVLLIFVKIEVLKVSSLIYFFIGIVLSISYNSRNLKINTFHYVLFFCILLTTYATNLYSDLYLGQILWNFCLLIIFFNLGSYLVSRPFGVVLRWFGQNSLLVLIFHAFFMVCFKPLAFFFLNIDNSGLLYSLIVTVFVSLFSVYTGFFLDLFNISKLIFGRKEIYKSFKSINESKN